MPNFDQECWWDREWADRKWFQTHPAQRMPVVDGHGRAWEIWYQDGYMHILGLGTKRIALSQAVGTGLAWDRAFATFDAIINDAYDGEGVEEFEKQERRGLTLEELFEMDERERNPS